MSEKLKPCPFCGGEAVYDRDWKGVQCRVCNARIANNFQRKKDAVEAWNTRPNPWRTGTHVEDGKYLVQHGKDFHEVLLVKDGKFMAVEYIETALGIRRHHYDVSETVVAWQKIEPYRS